jgi:alcohol dehydrogenase class IV
MLPYQVFDNPADLNRHCRTLIAAGGGKLIDHAKYLRATFRPDLRLIAMPSIWGSGAERSRVVVLDRAGVKEIHAHDRFLPDAIVYCEEFAASIPEWRARYACGDTWAHALEAFFSPLASPATRSAASALMQRMTQLSPASHDGWFEASGEACALQAISSVGLVHGIAHSLEAPLTAAFPDVFWGHSRLCSTFLYPVFLLNQSLSLKPAQLFDDYGMDRAEVESVLRDLFEPESYAQALPALIQHWPSVLRDKCSRTNIALVRPSSLSFFREFA